MPRAIEPWLRRAVMLFALSMAIEACGPGERAGDVGGAEWVAKVDTLGDTITITTMSGDGWGEATLVEELRIGKAEGTEAETFGRVTALAVAPRGDIYAYDEQSNAIRRFGADGADLGRVGRDGSGPGEYLRVAGMTVLDDGRLVAHDFGNRRFNLYAPDGSFRTSWQLPTDVAERRPLYQAGGRVFLYDWVRVDNGTDRVALLMRLDSVGQATDTLTIPASGYEPPFLRVTVGTMRTGAAVPFTAEEDWTLASSGLLVMMHADRYAIDIRQPNGMVRRLARETDVVPVSAAERTVEEARITARLRRIVPTWSWSGPRIPESKPPISWIHAGEGDRIWVRVAQPGHVLPEADRHPTLRSHVAEPVVFDVFEADGRFLGQVRAPASLQLSPHPILGRTHIWAIVTDADAVQYIARFRIVLP